MTTVKKLKKKDGEKIVLDRVFNMIEDNCYPTFNGMCMTIKKWNKIKKFLYATRQI